MIPFPCFQNLCQLLWYEIFVMDSIVIPQKRFLIFYWNRVVCIFIFF